MAPATNQMQTIEIRSYRAVFDLERRIYRVDRLKLNPSGVPVRGIVYFLTMLGCVLAIGRLPLLGLPAELVPWYLGDVLLPGGMAWILTVVTIEGRPFHLFARTLLRYGVGSHELAGLKPSSASARQWHPGELVMLADGSDACLRRIRYRGPGTVLVKVAHARTICNRGSVEHWLQRPHVTLASSPASAMLAEGQVIALPRGARLEVRR